MQAYKSFNGSNSEVDVIKYANALLNRKDVQDFLGRPDSFTKNGLDASLVLCSVLTEATPAGLANFTGQGKAQEALVDSLLANPLLMRDFLVAGGATNGMYGQAMTIYTNIVKVTTNDLTRELTKFLIFCEFSNHARSPGRLELKFKPKAS